MNSNHSVENVGTKAAATIDCGSRQQLERVFTQFSAAALRKCCRMISNKEICEEVVQEVFAKLWSKKMKFPSQEDCYKWIYRACHNRCIDHLRRYYQKNRLGFDPDALEECTPIVESFVSGNAENRAENSQIVARFLEVLTESEAEILFYTSVDGLNRSELSKLLKVDRKTLYRRFKKIEEKIKNFVEVKYA